MGDVSFSTQDGSYLKRKETELKSPAEFLIRLPPIAIYARIRGCANERGRRNPCVGSNQFFLAVPIRPLIAFYWEDPLETKSIRRLLSLLELGGQTALVRIYPAGAPSANEVSSAAANWSPGGDFSPSPDVTWYAELYMQAGQLQYSAVFNALGERILVDDQALNFLGQFGGVSYDLLPLPARPALPPPGASPSPSDSQPPKSTGTMPPSPGYPGRPPQLPETPSIPHSWGEPVRLPSGAYSPPANWRPVRTRWGEVVIQNAQQLTRDERRVLALINGQRTIPELSRLLGVSPEALANLLAYFQEQNLIS